MSLAIFLRELTEALHDGHFERLTLSKPVSHDERRNLYLRPIHLDGQSLVQITHRHPTQDRTENLPFPQVLALLTELLGTNFLAAHLDIASASLSLLYGRNGQPKLTRKNKTSPSPTLLAHDRKKQTLLTPELCPWLTDLGLADDKGRILPSRAFKWRQVTHFIELLDHALRDIDITSDLPLTVYDMGSGKGTLTFAVDTWLTDLRKIAARVTGIEQRPELVALCQSIARKHLRTSLSFQPGKIDAFDLPHFDLLIALHACDTATDAALAAGIRVSAKIIVVAPCCQHDVRKTFSSTPSVAGLFGHGLIEQRQAALLTDTLRILLLERAGYRVRAVEFVDAEHTDKNLLLIATHIQRPDPAADSKLQTLKQLFNLPSLPLEKLLS